MGKTDTGKSYSRFEQIIIPTREVLSNHPLVISNSFSAGVKEKQYGTSYKMRRVGGGDKNQR